MIKNKIDLTRRAMLGLEDLWVVVERLNSNNSWWDL